MSTNSPLQGRIAAHYAHLAPQERGAADILLDNLGDVATYRATELAGLAGVSKATFSRLVRRLGYDDFETLRGQLRELRQSGLPVAISPAPAFNALITQDVANLHRLQAGLDESTIDSIVETIARAQRVVVAGFRSSYSVASLLRMNLAQIRPGTWLAPQPGQSIADDTTGLDARDIAIVVSFRRHSAVITELIAGLRANSVPVLLISDTDFRALAPDVTWWLETPSSSPGAFDSHAAAMSLVTLLSNRLLARIAQAQDRVERVHDTYRTLHDISDA